jgi:biopolymer transport protein ExbD
MSKQTSWAKAFAGEGDPEFQLAPMIDVVFQLLIFFMCVTTLQTVRLSKNIDLPIARSSTKPEEGVSSAIINLEWQGAEKSPKVTINGLEKTFDEVTPFLMELYQRNPAIRVMLRADYRIRYYQVREIMNSCSKAGIAKVAFVTLQVEQRRITPR